MSDTLLTVEQLEAVAPALWAAWAPRVDNDPARLPDGIQAMVRRKIATLEQ